eukprot:3916512-Lingulodinium_polyedra.AAC.1
MLRRRVTARARGARLRHRDTASCAKMCNMRSAAASPRSIDRVFWTAFANSIDVQCGIVALRIARVCARVDAVRNAHTAE